MRLHFERVVAEQRTLQAAYQEKQVEYEEISAWDIGEELALKLKIRVSRKMLERYRTSSLLTYTRNLS